MAILFLGGRGLCFIYFSFFLTPNFMEFFLSCQTRNMQRKRKENIFLFCENIFPVLGKNIAPPTPKSEMVGP